MSDETAARFERAYYYSFVIPRGCRIRFIESTEQAEFPELELISDAAGGYIALDRYGQVDPARDGIDALEHVERLVSQMATEVTARRTLDEHAGPRDREHSGR
jgi:hypothetical protein